MIYAENGVKLLSSERTIMHANFKRQVNDYYSYYLNCRIAAERRLLCF